MTNKVSCSIVLIPLKSGDIMDLIKINGGKTLTGEIKIGGAKNSVVALIPAALLANGVSTITNVPDITDKNAIFDIVKHLGCKVKMDGTIVTIDSSKMKNKTITEELARRLRASYYFMGVQLAKYKRAEIYFPGGCDIGKRPIDLHLKGFEAMGAVVTHNEDDHKYIVEAEELYGARIFLDFASVGATINIMFAACLAKGITIIDNAAKETEIINIANFLNKMGAKITGAGTSTITIEGVEELHPADISVIPDRIEAGTYILLGAMLGDNLVISGINPDHITAVLSKLKDMGIKMEISNNKITISKAKKLKRTNIKTLVYPGFPTDLGQPMSVLLTQAKGKSYFVETIWENRMQHVQYLNEMGANIKLKDQSHAYIYGPTPLHGVRVSATDLRGGAALVVAGLIADGTTTISNIQYILRGYENLLEKLKNVGADIEIIQE